MACVEGSNGQLAAGMDREPSRELSAWTLDDLRAKDVEAC